MRRRGTPYSLLDRIRVNRREVMTLIGLTILLGVVLSVLGDAIYQGLRDLGIGTRWILIGSLGGTVLLTLVVIILFYSGAESDTVRLEMWLPYHVHGKSRVMIARHRGYLLTEYARRAWARCYPSDAPEARKWLARWSEARDAGEPFQKFVLEDHIALSQCMLLYALHRAGNEILGPEAGYGWWKVDLPARSVTPDALPPPLQSNPFFVADQRIEEWRLLLPKGVRLHMESMPGNPWPRWTLRHWLYGRIDLDWIPRVTVAGQSSQPQYVLTQGVPLEQRSEVRVVNARVQAQARFRWVLLPSGEAFHRWATHLLARLEEALDWAHFMRSRSGRILADLSWKVGRWDRGDSIADALGRIGQGVDALLVEHMVGEPKDEADG